MDALWDLIETGGVLINENVNNCLLVFWRVNKWVNSNCGYMVLWKPAPCSQQRYAFCSSKDKVNIVLKQTKQWSVVIWRWNLYWLHFIPDRKTLKSWDLELPPVRTQLVMVANEKEQCTEILINDAFPHVCAWDNYCFFFFLASW